MWAAGIGNGNLAVDSTPIEFDRLVATMRRVVAGCK